MYNSTAVILKSPVTAQYPINGGAAPGKLPTNVLHTDVRFTHTV
ncbi:hypothetical protein BSMD_020910 [Bacillus subtilis Miyagi-4]|nr:hypothetical protein BSMD_020910 [Bacillus subtilis Miyagi-4]